MSLEYEELTEKIIAAAKEKLEIKRVIVNN